MAVPEESLLFGFQAAEDLKTKQYAYDQKEYKPYFDSLSTGEYDAFYVGGGEDDATDSSQDLAVAFAVVALLPAVLLLAIKAL